MSIQGFELKNEESSRAQEKVGDHGLVGTDLGYGTGNQECPRFHRVSETLSL